MARYSAALAAASLSLLMAATAQAAPIADHVQGPTKLSSPSGLPYVPGELLVRFDNSASAGKRAALRDGVDGSVEDASLGVKNLQLLELDGGESPDEAADKLNAAGGVQYAHPNYVQQMYKTPDDPEFPLQWGLVNGGQVIEGLVGAADADIDAELAWDQTTGNPDFVAGIMDSGIATDHVDFAPNVVPGVDVSSATEDADPRDLNGHGSHVGGLTGAAGNNGAATAGVTWNTKIMPVRINVDTGVPLDAQIRGFQAVKDRGVRLANGSFGGRGGEIPAQKDAIAAASDTLFIIASGNDGASLDGNPSYPCSYDLPNIVCVGASTNQETVADFSNTSPTLVDLFAPGKDMRSTAPVFAHRLSPATEGATFEVNGDGFSVLSGNWGLTSPGLNGSAQSVTGQGSAAQVMSPAISTAGYSNCSLIVALGGIPQAGDGARVLVRQGAAGSLTPLLTLNGTEGLPQTGFDFVLPLQGFNGLADMRVVLEVTSVNPRYLFDDVRVKCNPDGVSPSATKYISGTSQATPVVTGVAALIFGQDPKRPLTEVREALLAGVDKLPAYAGKAVTGGRINANAAVTAGADSLAARIAPVPSGLATTKSTFSAQTGKGASLVSEKELTTGKKASSSKKKAKKKKKKTKKLTGGTVLKFTMSKAGKVTFDVNRTFKGTVNKKGACTETKTTKKKSKSKSKSKSSAKKKKKKTKVKKCSGSTAIGSFSTEALAGANRTGFTGRVANKPLKIGSYTLKVTGVAKNGTTRSTPVSTNFKIKAAPKTKKKSKKKKK